jgi:hypothetical protein
MKILHPRGFPYGKGLKRNPGVSSDAFVPIKKALTE